MSDDFEMGTIEGIEHRLRHLERRYVNNNELKKLEQRLELLERQCKAVAHSCEWLSWVLHTLIVDLDVISEDTLKGRMKIAQDTFDLQPWQPGKEDGYADVE